MHLPHRPSPSAPLAWRRLATAALLALQSLVALSPVADRVAPIPRVEHTHDQERHHGRLHDEATCAVCASQKHAAEAAEPRAGGVRRMRPFDAPLADRPTILSRAPRSSKSPRAPPVVS